MKNFKRAISMLMVVMMLVTFSFSSTSNATNNVTVDDQSKGTSTYSISVSKSNGMVYRTIKDLDLRSGDSDTSKSITIMEQGSYVKHLGTTDSNWFKVDYDGKIGYVHRRDVTSQSNYDKNYSDIVVSPSNGMEYRTIQNLHLREGNSTNYKSLVIMPKGSKVKHLGTADGGWFKLEYQGKVGYAHRNHVTSLANYDRNYGDKKDDTIAVSPATGIEYKTIKNLDLREGNSDNHKSMLVMKKGSLVKHLGTTDNDWFKLDYDGKIGYAHRSHVTSLANYEKNYNDIIVSGPNGNIYRTITNLNLREGDSTSYNSIVVMPKGSKVRHLGTTGNDWFKLEYNGKVGFAHRNYVTSQANYDKNHADPKDDYDHIEVGKPNGREYITIRDLDLRNGNSDSHDSIIVMPKGAYVKHLGTTVNDWFKLDYNGKIGFAHRSQVTVPKTAVKPEASGPMVFLDYGHGGSDPGSSYKGRREKDDALRLGLLVAKELRKSGVLVDESRTTDVYPTLQQRSAAANKKDYNYFVSIHRNAFKPETAKGVETFAHSKSSEKSKSLSRAIYNNLVGVGFYGRGAKFRDNLYVLNNTKAPAVLIEVGFIDNTGDNIIFDSKINQIAKTIANAILSELAK